MDDFCKVIALIVDDYLLNYELADSRPCPEHQIHQHVHQPEVPDIQLVVHGAHGLLESFLVALDEENLEGNNLLQLVV